MIDAVLSDRASKYGDFVNLASIAQSLKKTIRNTPRWHTLTDDKKEALEMVVHKMARILNGDPSYKDSWTDIIGYVKRIEDTLSD